MFLNEGDNLLDIISGVDDNRLARLLITNDRAIALQGTYRQNFMNHSCILVEAPAAPVACAKEKSPREEDLGFSNPKNYFCSGAGWEAGAAGFCAGAAGCDVL